MTKAEELKMRVAVLNLQKESLIRRYERQKKRDAFVKKHYKKIVALSMDGWPRTKNMKDFRKWFDLIFLAKVNGVYGMGTSNCDVIAQLHRFAKAINNKKYK